MNNLKIKIDCIFHKIFFAIPWLFMRINTFQAKLRLGSAGKKVKIYYPSNFQYYHNVHLGNNIQIHSNSIFVCSIAKIIIRDNVMIGKNSLFVSGNHNTAEIHKFQKNSKLKYPVHDKGIIVNEDVFIIFNATILDGVNIGRGAIIGTGAVVRQSVPPYAIVLGNPAKVVGFRFTPQQVLEHESFLYKEEDRLSLGLLEKNYRNYYLEKFSEIVRYVN